MSPCPCPLQGSLKCYWLRAWVAQLECQKHEGRRQEAGKGLQLDPIDPRESGQVIKSGRFQELLSRQKYSSQRVFPLSFLTLVGLLWQVRMYYWALGAQFPESGNQNQTSNRWKQGGIPLTLSFWLEHFCTNSGNINGKAQNWLRFF